MDDGAREMKELAILIASIFGCETDQQRCQAEADAMARHRWFQHIGPTIGSFEGIGWGRCPNPLTCEPEKWKGYRVTGDATAKTSEGVTVRVRAWR